MKNIIFIVAVSILLSGCVSRRMNEGLTTLNGQDISVAVARIGYPDGQRKILGDTIFVWGRSENSIMPMSTTSTTTGMVGSAPVYGTTTFTNFVPVNYNCSIQIAVDSHNIIKSWQWSGNSGGCSPYAKALTRNQ